jgi:hypothetical protein
MLAINVEYPNLQCLSISDVDATKRIHLEIDDMAEHLRTSAINFSDA